IRDVDAMLGAEPLHECDVLGEFGRVERRVTSILVRGGGADWNLDDALARNALFLPAEVLAAQVFADVVPLVSGGLGEDLVGHAVQVSILRIAPPTLVPPRLDRPRLIRRQLAQEPNQIADSRLAQLRVVRGKDEGVAHCRTDSCRYSITNAAFPSAISCSGVAPNPGSSRVIQPMTSSAGMHLPALATTDSV